MIDVILCESPFRFRRGSLTQRMADSYSTKGAALSWNPFSRTGLGISTVASLVNDMSALAVVSRQGFKRKRPLPAADRQCDDCHRAGDGRNSAHPTRAMQRSSCKLVRSSRTGWPRRRRSTVQARSLIQYLSSGQMNLQLVLEAQAV